MTAGFEVEDDLSWDQLESKRRRPAASRARTGGKEPDTTRDYLPEEYRWFASYGLAHDAIARRLGIESEALAARLRRAGVPTAKDPIDVTAERVLNDLIASGRPFMASEIPEGTTEASTLRLIQMAQRAGRIRRTGKDTLGYTIWEGVPRDA